MWKKEFITSVGITRRANSDSIYLSNIEKLFGLAIDTDISDIIITSDFNLNVTNPNTLRKLESICSQFSFYQLIVKPTHVTEQSLCIINLIIATHNDNLVLSGVVDPFLKQNII